MMARPDALPRALRPCAECPWRLDQPSGRFPADRYRALAATARHTDGICGVTAPLFACHKSTEGRDIACAGWLAVCGADQLNMRLAVVRGRLDGAALQPGQDWPDLHPDYIALAVANGVPADDPALEGTRSSRNHDEAGDHGF